MSAEILVLFFTCVANLGLGFFVLLRNPRILSSISFFALTVSISIWAVSNYLTEVYSIPLQANVIFNRLAYLFGLSCLVFIVIFCHNFPVKHEINLKKKFVFFGTVAAMALLSVTDLIDGRVIKHDGELHYSLGILAIPYTIFLFCLLILGTTRMLKTRAHSNRQVKNQITLILIGFIVCVTMSLLLNVILPSLGKSFATAKFGPLISVLFVASTTYAIVKHKLFDIRLIVARSLAYILSLVILILIFSFGALSLTDVIFKGNTLGDTVLREIYTGLAVIVALVFPVTKQYFDKVTNRIFYRDAYDAQLFLNNLNKAIIEDIDIHDLLKRVAEVIKVNIKCSHVTFYLFDDTMHARTVGTKDTVSNNVDVTAFNETSKIDTPDVIIYDSQHVNSHLMHFMRKNDVAVLAQLKSHKNMSSVAGVWMCIGTKRNGASYTEQDLSIIQIISNELAIAVQNALRFEEIQSFNATLQEKIDTATRQLRRTNEKLKTLDETKDDFISMASHQLRTPLTSIKGYVSMVLEGDAGKINSTQREMLTQSYQSSQRMVYLIADLLNVSRLKTGKFIIEPAIVNLVEIIEQELSQLRETAASRSLTLAFEKPHTFPDLMLDETKTRQIIMNFADNAIYYTPTGGKILIKLSETSTSVEFRVIDNGIGVPKSEQQHLFTKFYRAGNARKARPDGTGLGLYMAKKVIVAQGGTLIFDSKEGKGSTFGFVFSKAKLAVPAEPK